MYHTDEQHLVLEKLSIILVLFSIIIIAYIFYRLILFSWFIQSFLATALFLSRLLSLCQAHWTLMHFEWNASHTVKICNLKYANKNIAAHHAISQHDMQWASMFF